MKSKKLRFMILLLTAITIAVTGCAPPVVQKKEINIVWPLPPEEPRIKFVRFIRSTDDIGKELSFSDSVFGDEAASGFAKPYGVVVDKKGVIHVSDIGAVWAIDIENHDYSFIGDKPGAGRLRIPLALATSADGRLFVSDLASDRVFVFSDGRNIGALGQEGKFISVSGIAIDDERKLIYVCDSNKHNVFVYSLEDYSELRTLGERGHDEGNFNFPTNIALDSSGNLYVVDTGNFRVQIFDPEGNLVRTFGQLGDLPGTFTRPKGIALDSEDNIYVVDAAFQNVQVFDSRGRALMFFGGAGRARGKMNLPTVVKVDYDNVEYFQKYVADGFEIEYLILVVNQFGSNKVQVFGFGSETD